MLVGIQGTCNKVKIKNHKFKSHLMKNLPFLFLIPRENDCHCIRLSKEGSIDN